MKYNRLLAIEFLGINKHRKKVYLWQCDCGHTTYALLTEVKNNHTKSCGCISKEKHLTHGMHDTQTYQCWADMKQRCNNPKYKQYKDYGGRGITVCDSWNRFEGFYADMGDKPPGLTLERTNNNLGYNKENCTWVTRAQQNRNQRRHYKTEEVCAPC
jgi:hypothetical protein